MFYHRNEVVERKMTREMRRFTIEPAAFGCGSRMCETAVAGYVRVRFTLCSHYMVELGRLGPHCDGAFDVMWSKSVSELFFMEAIADCWTP